ncbi:unnamed protein product [Linum tenue]|uniref:C2H2-type domain-containing protein n=1 Tax=Linum tenue TaxID=586396 RepID=A0AAV0RK99_9ROSI|nr:unnamed protein product [Linum tenue]
MDPEDEICGETWGTKSSLSNSLQEKSADFGSQQQLQKKWDNNNSSCIMDYGFRIGQQQPPFREQINNSIQGKNSNDNKPPEWDPSAMLNNLSFLEQKIHQLNDMVHLIITRKGRVPSKPDELLTQQQQQLITADLTSIIVQLISTAGTLLPSVKTIGQFSQFTPKPAAVSPEQQHQQPNNSMDVDHNYTTEEHEEHEDGEAEHLPPGSYEILQLEKEEILAPHTHFCTICGKGFKRDANLRMHMRGHGDEYKTPAALAKPPTIKEVSSAAAEPVMIKRYSCPFSGCKRNKDHKKFQPLKTILCVKNHYKRTHCDKSYVCSRCNTKKFSVMADLKTHEKHCGRDKWLCSCGTTFSRKDKLFGHIALFQGHTPAIPPDETKTVVALAHTDDPAADGGGLGDQALMDFKSVDDPVGAAAVASCFSPLNFDSCNFGGGFPDFNRQGFDDSEASFSFLLSGGSCNYSNQNTGGES